MILLFSFILEFDWVLSRAGRDVSGMNGLIVLEDSLERDRRWCEIVETRGKKCIIHYTVGS